MTETRGQCPAHQTDTMGHDSYFWDTTKEMGYCHSCGLSTWLYKDNLWGKTTDGRKFKVDSYGEHMGDTVAGEEQQDGIFEDFTPKAIDTNTDKGSYQSWRGINENTMEHFGVKTSGDEIHFVYPSGGAKVRKKSVKEFWAKGLKGDELFGMQRFPAGCAKKVTITEGEADCLSAWQMLQSGNYINPVVSLPGATPSGKLWEKCKGWLDSFDEIILSVDNDEPGRKVAEVISEIFPGKVFVMDHGQHKDANDFLMNGDAKAYKNAWWKAKRHKPESILSDVDDYLSLYDDSPDFEYFQTGIQELDNKMLGICKGYVTLIQAESGLGKTEFCRYLEHKALETGKYRVAAMHLEESKVRSLLGLVSYRLNTNVTIKKFIDEKQLDAEVRESIKEIATSENFITFDFDMHGGHEGLIKQVRYLVAAMNVDFVFIEPVQDCVTGSSSEKEGKLADLITQLSTLASKLNVGIVVVAHQNSDGGAMYSSMITKRAAFELLLKRDRDSDDPEERNRTYVVIGRKNRTGLGNGTAGAVDFDLESYTLTPVMPPMAPATPNRKEDF